jgi:hypothetical protein
VSAELTEGVIENVYRTIPKGLESTETLEKQIDELVFDLYGLTEEEKKNFGVKGFLLCVCVHIANVIKSL